MSWSVPLRSDDDALATRMGPGVAAAETGSKCLQRKGACRLKRLAWGKTNDSNDRVQECERRGKMRVPRAMKVTITDFRDATKKPRRSVGPRSACVQPCVKAPRQPLTGRSSPRGSNASLRSSSSCKCSSCGLAHLSLGPVGMQSANRILLETPSRPVEPLGRPEPLGWPKLAQDLHVRSGGW